MTQSDEHPMYASHLSYDDQLNRGLRLSGSGKDYFATARIAMLGELWHRQEHPVRVLDFGAGDGSTLPLLRQTFPAAHLVAVEPSAAARGVAAEKAAPICADVIDPRDLSGEGTFDLIHLNGVVHHVPPPERDALIARLASLCSVDGLVVVFENNPWNPGARLVMRRIPFDKDVVMVWPHQLRNAFIRAGLTSLSRGSIFFFPRSATAAPRVEKALRRTMAGAQYYYAASARPALSASG